MTTPEYDPTSGYQPDGGWGYNEWGAAGAEAWDHAGQATQNGDPTTVPVGRSNSTNTALAEPAVAS